MAQMTLSDLSALIERIQAKEDMFAAMVPNTFDSDRILAAAADLYNRYPDSDSRPPLFCFPIGVKDVIRVDGLPTRCGSQLPSECFAGPEADAVRALRDAGALVLAKTVTTEFALRAPGPTRNPHNPKHTPGGSSSGSAAGVAAGYFPLALGTQMGGSVIRPASYCGIIGFKPSLGRISTRGIIGTPPSADHLGLLCDSLETLGMALSVLLDPYDQPDNLNSAAMQSFGIPAGPYLDRVSDEMRQHFDAVIAWLERQGVYFKAIDVFTDLSEIITDHMNLLYAELYSLHEPWLDTYFDKYHESSRNNILSGREISLAQLGKLQQGALDLRQALTDSMDAHRIDAWICPAAVGAAPEGLHYTGAADMNIPWTRVGLPTISIPTGKNGQGLPLGTQLIGRFGKDELLCTQASFLTELLAGRV